MPATGRNDVDFIGRSFSIFGKLVLDQECNLVVSNSTVQNVTIQDTLFVRQIYEEEALEGITFTGNVMMSPGYAIITPHLLANIAQVEYLRERSSGHGVIVQSDLCVQDGNILKASKIDEQISGNGLVVSNFLPRLKFGTGRVWLLNNSTIDESGGTQVEFTEKTFESFNTTSSNLIHPSGNTLTTFIAPTIAEAGCAYGNAVVRVVPTIGTHFINGGYGDEIILKVVKNKVSVVSQYTHTLSNTSVDVYETISWSDMVLLPPGEQIDIYAEGSDNSGLLDAEVVGGTATSYVTFEIVSFEP